MLTNRKEMPKQKKVPYKPGPDAVLLNGESYDVENITDVQVRKDNSIEYAIKWLGWPAKDNTYQTESCIMTPPDLIKFWRSCSRWPDTKSFGPGPGGLITKGEIMNGLLLAASFEGLSTRFVTSDNVTMKKLYQPMIERYGWQHRITMYERTQNKEIRRRLNEYYSQLITLGYLLPEVWQYFEVDREELHPKKWLTMPLPIPKMVFGDMDTYAELRGLIKDNYAPEALILTTADMRRLVDHLLEKHPERNVDGIDNPDYDPMTDEEFLDELAYQAKSETAIKALRLARDVDNVWFMKSAVYPTIPADTHLLPICGEVVDGSVAEKCLREEGELIAFHNFVALPGGKCLDRRTFSDLTQYIPHSCTPNCRVELTRGHKGSDQLMVVTDRVIKWGEMLTLDWYKGFDSDLGDMKGWDAHLELLNKEVDHVFCQREEPDCPVILWVENQAKKVRGTKADKLKQMQNPRFNGMQLLDN